MYANYVPTPPVSNTFTRACSFDHRGSALKYDAYQEHTGFAKGSKQASQGGVSSSIIVA